MRLSTHLGLLTALTVSTVNAIPTIYAKGSKFFTSEGNQYYVKGIAYQLLPDDPLVDGTQCANDAALMKTLGANAIRVYHVDPAANHDSCMKTFADAGIYLFVDLDTFTTQINQDAPEWTQRQAGAFAAVMDAFQKYDNTAGFFVGNEVLNQPSGSGAAPFVKAAARDMKAYRNSKGYRNIPVGYSAADIASLRPMLQDYLACGGKPEETIDFFALNTYEWCGDVTYETSGYANLNSYVQNYSIPIWVSETGCIVPKPRSFADQTALLGPQMNGQWSGSMIYEWIQEENDYGLIQYPKPASGGFGRSGTPTPLQPDFNNLQNQWKTLNPTGIKAADYNPTLAPPACPASTASVWAVNPNAPLPTLGQVVAAVVTASTGAGNTAAASTAAVITPSASSSSTLSSTQVPAGNPLTGVAAVAIATSSGAGSASAPLSSVTTSPNSILANGTTAANTTTRAAAATTTTSASAGVGSPSKELKGMGIGLAGVLLGFFAWL